MEPGLNVSAPASSPPPVLPVPPSAPGEKSGAAYCTYRVGGPLRQAYEPATVDELLALLQTLSPQERRQLHCLGWGSNTLISDNGIAGPCLIFRKLAQVEHQAPNVLRFSAGVHLAQVAHVAATTVVGEEDGEPLALSGVEFLVGIPGTVGGAVRMNAGAHGGETADRLVSLRVVNLETLAVEDWTPQQLAFAYRHSALDPSTHLALWADFHLTPSPQAQIQATTAQHRQWRKDCHPTEPNGGSVFKNPKTQTDKAVGWMIDTLGLKGFQVGGAMISPKHGNFIVNTGNATCTDVLRVMAHMKAQLYQHFQVVVQPENLLLGDSLSDTESALWAFLTAPQWCAPPDVPQGDPV